MRATEAITVATAEAPREMDAIAATGEQARVDLLALALHARGVAAVSPAGSQVPIETDRACTKARIRSIDDARVRAALDAGHAVISIGFHGIHAAGNVTTVTSNSRHMLVQLTDGTLRRWGHTDFGQVGAGVKAGFQLSPAKPKIEGVKAVFAVDNSSLG